MFRLIHVAGCCVALLLPSHAIAGESWVGKNIVIVARKLPKFGHTDDSGRQTYYGELTRMIYIVLGDQDGWLKVRDYGKEGWFDKADAVLFENAIAYLTKQIRADPNNTQALGRRGTVLREKGEHDLAIKDLNEVIRLDPANKAAYLNRGHLFIIKNNYDRAIADYNESIRLNPTSSAYCGRGVAFSKQGNYDRAIASFEEAVRLEPNDSWPFNNLAWLMATCPKAGYRNGRKAIEYARKACELAGWDDNSSLDTLAAAYAEDGQFEQAVRWQRRAMALADQNSRTRYEQRLRRYEQRMPYHE